MDTNLLKNIGVICSTEEIANDDIKKSREYFYLNKVKKVKLNCIKKSIKSGDLSLIVKIEKTLVKNDLQRYVNSKAMEANLKAALEDMTVIEKHLNIIDDPVKYKIIDLDHSKPKNRKNGLPYDEARRAFKSQDTRLYNADSATLSDVDKELIAARKAGINTAHKLYIQRQAKTLAVDLNKTAEKYFYYAVIDNRHKPDTGITLPVYNSIKSVINFKNELRANLINDHLSFYKIPEKLTDIKVIEGQKRIILDTDTVKKSIKIAVTEAENLPPHVDEKEYTSQQDHQDEAEQ